MSINLSTALKPIALHDTAEKCNFQSEETVLIRHQPTVKRENLKNTSRNKLKQLLYKINNNTLKMVEDQMGQHELEEKYIVENLLELMRDNNSNQGMQLTSGSYTNVSDGFRQILISWIGQTCQLCQFGQQTFLLAARYFDDYLLARNIPSDQLEIVGRTCIYIASKYLHRTNTSMNQLCQLKRQDIQITKRQVSECEAQILGCFDFRLMRTTPFTLLSYLITKQNSPVVQLCKYLIVLAIHKGLNRIFRQTTLVIASLLLAECILARRIERTNVRRALTEFENEDGCSFRCFQMLCTIYLQGETEDLLYLRVTFWRPYFKKQPCI